MKWPVYSDMASAFTVVPECLRLEFGFIFPAVLENKCRWDLQKSSSPTPAQLQQLPDGCCSKHPGTLFLTAYVDLGNRQRAKENILLLMEKEAEMMQGILLNTPYIFL